MKKILYSFVLVFTFALVSCDRDPIDRNNSIFDTDEPERNAFDEWLFQNYVLPYNIRFIYRFEDIESDMRYNLVPARLDRSIEMAQIVKHVWLEAYREVTAADFLPRYAPRIIHLVGSAGHNIGQGTIVLGTAEGGLKVTLLVVNWLDLQTITMEDLNRFYFRTMHHEFAHILHQTRPFDARFAEISDADYVGNDWIYSTYAQARALGFVSPYSRMNANEDFVELFAWYITNTREWWIDMLRSTGWLPRDQRPADYELTGGDIIEEKMEILHDYFNNEWGIDLDKLRDVVLRRNAEVLDGTLEFLTFPDFPEEAMSAYDAWMQSMNFELVPISEQRDWVCSCHRHRARRH